MRRVLILLVLGVGCAKEPPTETLSTPSGNQYRVQTHERVAYTTGDVFSVVYLTDTLESDAAVAAAEDLFQWVKPEAESAGLDKVVIAAHRLTDEMFGMAKRVDAIEVMYQKGRDGEWGHSRPRNSGQK